MNGLRQPHGVRGRHVPPRPHPGSACVSLPVVMETVPENGVRSALLMWSAFGPEPASDQ